MLQFTGTLKIKKDEQVISDKFKKMDIVISDDHDSYPQLVSFQLANDNIDKIKNVEVGSKITVTFNLRGREWTNKEGVVMHFNTLDAWKVDVVGATPTGSAPAPSEEAKAAANTTALDDGDLPF